MQSCGCPHLHTVLLRKTGKTLYLEIFSSFRREEVLKFLSDVDFVSHDGNMIVIHLRVSDDDLR